MQSTLKPRAEAVEIARVFRPMERRLKLALQENEYDQADLVRRTTEDWRDFVANLDRAAAHLED